MRVTVTIPGEPCAQGRGRAAVVNGHARVFDPAKSRSWKGAARHEMERAYPYRKIGGSNALPFPAGPVAVTIRAFHTCPKGAHRKREPTPARWRGTRPDAENVAKAVLDAATGVLWADDAQVARLVVEQVTAAQGEAPRVEIEVTALPEVYLAALFEETA